MGADLIQAVMLKSKDGKDFVAFFDFAGRLPYEKQAWSFVDMIALLVSVSITLTYQDNERHGEWRTIGYNQGCVEVAEAISIRDVRVFDIILCKHVLEAALLQPRLAPV